MLTESIKRYMVDQRLIWVEDLYCDGVEYIVGDFEKKVLFLGNRKIQSIRQFQSIMVRFLCLNPDVDYEDFYQWVEVVNYYENGSVVNSFNLDSLEGDCIRFYDLHLDGKLKPNWLKRKIVFRSDVGKSRKCQIIGMEFSKGKKYTDEVIKEAFDELSSDGDTVTLKDISNHLGCTQTTLSRNITEKTKEEISNYNKRVREDRDYINLINSAKELIEEVGVDKLNVTVRLLRSISSVRNKEVTARALEHLERLYDKTPKSKYNNDILHNRR